MVHEIYQTQRTIDWWINDHAMDCLRYMCQYLAEPKRGGGVLLATFTEDEEQSYRAQEVANNGSRFTTDFRDLYYGNDIEW